MVERLGRWGSSTAARTVYDSSNLASRKHFVNVVTNQLSTGLPIRKQDTVYLNSDGDFDLSGLIKLLQDTSDLTGASIPLNPFVAMPYCFEDMPLVLSIILHEQESRRVEIMDDPELVKGSITNEQDVLHTFILASRKISGTPAVRMSLLREYETAQIDILKSIRGKNRAAMGKHIVNEVAIFSDVSLTFGQKVKAFDIKYPPTGAAAGESESSDDSGPSDDDDDDNDDGDGKGTR